MKITLLGQAGILMSRGGVNIMIDPYLSDSVFKSNPENYRRLPVDNRFFEVSPDVMIFTHSHIDHYDPETAPVFLDRREKKMTVLSPTSVWSDARTHGYHNYVLFDRGTEWSQHGFIIKAVKAVHSDQSAIGVLITDELDGRVYYIAGDTLYSEDVISDIPRGVNAAFVPINGVGNNMNARDAARLVGRIGAKAAIPVHYGMFDSMDGAELECESRVIMKPYFEYEI